MDPLTWAVQVLPPSTVSKIAPPSPHTQPVFASMKEAAIRAVPTCGVVEDQVAPASVVFQTSSPPGHHAVLPMPVGLSR